ncbi:DUF5677 domain-containing protein [Caulobacter sp.]|uniref:DUF5677 domain-containing protein n=1 Tax=Caulobacter sp. TaxID=78 RepID=UPI0031D8E4A0
MRPELEDHPAILSIRAEGFLSPAIAAFTPSLRAMHAAWFALAEDISRHGQGLMNGLERVCHGRSTHDPVCLTTRLLMRSLSGFQGAVLLAERGMAVDAETLARGVLENAFWLGYLARTPQEAVAALTAEEQFSQRARDRALLKDLQQDRSGRQALAASLRARIARADADLKGAKPISLPLLAERGGGPADYFAYKMLSSGAAHASLHSLSKHLASDGEGTWSGHVTGPDADGAQRALVLATHALLTGLRAVESRDGAAPSDVLVALSQTQADLWANLPSTGEPL